MCRILNHIILLEPDAGNDDVSQIDIQRATIVKNMFRKGKLKLEP